MADKNVDFPWNPPPMHTFSEPLFSPMPCMDPRFGMSIDTCTLGGLWNGTQDVMGKSESPLARANLAPFGTNATRPWSLSLVRSTCWSSMTSTCRSNARVS